MAMPPANSEYIRLEIVLSPLLWQSFRQASSATVCACLPIVAQFKLPAVPFCGRASDYDEIVPG
jgi:hypothetical protein